MNLLGLESDVRSCVSFVAEVAIRISSHLDWEGSEEHTSELQSRLHLVCRLLLEKKTKPNIRLPIHLFIPATPGLRRNSTFPANNQGARFRSSVNPHLLVYCKIMLLSALSRWALL